MFFFIAQMWICEPRSKNTIFMWNEFLGGEQTLMRINENQEISLDSYFGADVDILEAFSLWIVLDLYWFVCHLYGIWMSPQLPLLDLSGHLCCCLCGMASQGFSKPQLSSSGMATPLTDQYQGQYTIAALQMGSAEAQSWKICLENSENLYFKCKESSLNMCETVKKNRFSQ